MALYKFKSEDVLVNGIEAYPNIKFAIYTGTLYYNDRVDEFGIPNGNVSLNELGTLTAGGADYYAFITKESSRIGWKTVSVTEFNEMQWGDTLTASLPLTASIQSEYFPASDPRLHVDALKNVSNSYRVLSNHYAFSSSLGDKATQIVRLISFPSIFYGSAIKKGSVDLKFYHTGTLIGELQDKTRNGNLIQVGPSGSTESGSVAGVVYYNEGFILLTGSWNLNSSTDNYEGSTTPRWVDFACVDDGLGTPPQLSSYEINMSGTQTIPVLTMLAHANKADLNHSNNPTYITYGQGTGSSNPYGVSTGTLGYYERDDLYIKNVAKYPYTVDTGSFRKETYISKIGIYDENKNLIGIGKLATPVRKRENDQFTFKLKLDI
jgi:hypothetical protein